MGIENGHCGIVKKLPPVVRSVEDEPGCEEAITP